ncbi:hypothetical protein [Georgenia ruanii]|uniref:hypothetical protein n=1 Tax=Georgenia ruanii TaxID=348442 RepID=UPI001264D8CD|nr:hypothetical protein [Georgenia ruanii]
MAFLTPEAIAAAARARRAADAYRDERDAGATGFPDAATGSGGVAGRPVRPPLPGHEAARAWALELARRGG